MALLAIKQSGKATFVCEARRGGGGGGGGGAGCKPTLRFIPTAEILQSNQMAEHTITT